jgi:hypothetical protein
MSRLTEQERKNKPAYKSKIVDILRAQCDLPPSEGEPVAVKVREGVDEDGISSAEYNKVTQNCLDTAVSNVIKAVWEYAEDLKKGEGSKPVFISYVLDALSPLQDPYPQDDCCGSCVGVVDRFLTEEEGEGANEGHEEDLP